MEVIYSAISSGHDMTKLCSHFTYLHFVSKKRDSAHENVGGSTELLWCKKSDVTDVGPQRYVTDRVIQLTSFGAKTSHHSWGLELTSFGAKNVTSLTGARTDLLDV